MAESKSAVLPLDESPIVNYACEPSVVGIVIV